MSWNLPDGCTDADVDRAAGGYDLDPQGEDPDNLLVDQDPADGDDGCAAECPFPDCPF